MKRQRSHPLLPAVCLAVLALARDRHEHGDSREHGERRFALRRFLLVFFAVLAAGLNASDQEKDAIARTHNHTAATP